MRKTTLKLPDLFLLLPVTCILARSVPKTEWFTICHPDLMTVLVWQRFFSFSPSPISGLMVTCMSVLDSSTSIKPLFRPRAVLDVVQGDSGGGLVLQLGLSSIPIISVINSCWLWPGASLGSGLGSSCCYCRWWRSCCPPSCERGMPGIFNHFNSFVMSTLYTV